MNKENCMKISLFRSDQERKVVLSAKEQEHVLKIDSSFLSIIEAIYFDNYAEGLYRPMPCDTLGILSLS